jgi:tetratricopeptide (TPR) repeat protein
MDEERWAELKDTFETLVDLLPAEQAQRVAALASTDPELSRHLEALLSADARADSLLAPFEPLPSRDTAFDAGASESATAATSAALDPFGLAGRTVSHFRVLEPLGAGGMGVVYRAQDMRLGRTVALKFLLPQYSLDASAKERFLREARAASALDHPNVCAVHEVGESEQGQLFLAMGCYAGEALKARLAGTGPLPLAEVAEIARQVPLGLGAAHSAGIVHRDLKPGNLMLTPEGVVKILDFGLAKVRDLQLTDPEQRPGTVAYMSPEQLQGEALDPRTDLWSLGVVLYEMLTGRTPFGGGHDLSTVYNILHEEPAPPSTLREEVPQALDEIVGRLLRKEPQERYASAAETLAALKRAVPEAAARDLARGAADWKEPVRPAAANSADPHEPLLPEPGDTPRNRGWMVVAGALVLCLALIPALVIDRSNPVIKRERVFVAAFENLTGDPGLDPLGRMAADWLTQGLAQAGVAEVVPTITPFGLPESVDSPRPPREVRQRVIAAHAREAGAGTVVSGAYYRQGDSVLVQAQVTDVRTGRIVGGIPAVGGRADRPLDAVEAMRGNVIAVLATRFDKTVASLAEVSSQPPSLEAYREYTEGVENFLRSAYPVAVSHFDRAVALDSAFTMAAIWSAFSRLNLGRHAQADSITQRLIPHREQLPPFDRTMLDALRATFQGDLPGQARATYAGAELAPGSFGQYAAAFYALRINHPREAVELLSGVDPDRADHRGWIWYWDVLTSAHHMLGEHRKELHAAREARNRYPDRLEAAVWEARALAALGRIAEMEETLVELPHLQAFRGPGPGTALRLIAEELRAHGHPEASQRLLERAITAYERLPAEELASAAVRSELAAALVRIGRYREARELFAALAAEDPANIEYLGYLGVIAAREGHAHEAERIAAQLAALDRPYMFGLNTFWRARIAALLGQQQDAVGLLQAAFAEGRPYSIAWHTEPDFESLHSNPAFRRFLRPSA